MTFLRIYGELFVANASHGFSGKSAIRLSRGHQPENVLPSTLPSSTSASFFSRLATTIVNDLADATDILLRVIGR